MPHATFPCPLRRDGRVVTLEAALEPEPPLLIVTHRQGGRAHAAVFGALEGQTLAGELGAVGAMSRAR